MWSAVRTGFSSDGGAISRVAGSGGSSGRAQNATNVGFVVGSILQATESQSGRAESHRRTPARGAAAGPSDMTVEHLKPMLETEVGRSSFVRGGRWIRPWRGTPRSRERIEDESHDSTPGDVFRRLVARTMPSSSIVVARVQQPHFSFALSTIAGCKCVSSGRQRTSMTGQPLCLWTALGHTTRSPVTACRKGSTEWLTETR